jgi:predicted regulator of Ras-like GTPase activity (Roadblock/LC7/MglB family)
MSKQEQFTAVIRELRENVPDITGVMIATVDGLSIGTDFPEDEAARVAAMGASSIGLGNRMSKVAEIGNMKDMMIEGDDGLLIIYMAEPGGILALRAPVGANLGLIRLDGPKAARKVAEIMTS